VQETINRPGTGDAFIEQARETLRRKCRSDPFFYIYWVLGYRDIDTDLHRDMLERWIKRRHRLYSLWLVPRGHLKTSLWTIGVNMWEVLLDPNCRILLVNAVYSKAQGMMQEIRSHYEINDVHRWLFPEYSLDLCSLPKQKKKLYKMTDERIDVGSGQRGGRREGNFECLGVEMSLVSKHYDIMHFDDAENDLNTATADYRTKIWTWFLNSWQLRHSPRESKIRDVGTPWHLDGIHNRIIKTERARRKAGKPAKWLLYRRAAKEATQYSDREEPIWPERFTHEVLDGLKDELGNYIYSCQYMCQAVSPEDALFREDQIQFIHEDYLPEDLVNFAAVDLSDSGDDFTVVVVASFDPQGKMYVRQILRGHIRPLELIEALRSLNRIWNLQKVAIETTGFQRTIARFYRDYAEEKGFHISWTEMSRAKTHKLRRFLALQPIVERGYFHVVKDISNTQEMVDELISCSPDHLPTHDDILDCLADIIQIYYAATPEEIEEKPTGSINDLFGTLDDDDDEDFGEDGYSESSHLGRSQWRVA
jgi:hypothetical protein